jgi:hypothetical protein
MHNIGVGGDLISFVTNFWILHGFLWDRHLTIFKRWYTVLYEIYRVNWMRANTFVHYLPGKGRLGPIPMGSCMGTPRAQGPHANLGMSCTACYLVL